MTDAVLPTHAPPEGTVLCRLADIPDGGGCERAFGPEHERLRILLLRRGDQVWAYVNQCPHFFLPLNYEPDVFCTYGGEILMCAHHCAMFRFDDGVCIDGPCAGRALRKVPIYLAQGHVHWGVKRSPR